jgi:hypothetical protein
VLNVTQNRRDIFTHLDFVLWLVEAASERAQRWAEMLMVTRDDVMVIYFVH